MGSHNARKNRCFTFDALYQGDTRARARELLRAAIRELEFDRIRDVFRRVLLQVSRIPRNSALSFAPIWTLLGPREKDFSIRSCLSDKRALSTSS